MREILEETQNRELSWLRFNQRVLEEARDETVPLMERMKFVAIFTSNLDEFFMIRVGSLYDMASADSKKIDQRSGMTAKQQLDAIYRAVSPLYKERDKTYAEIKKQLSPYGVCGLDFKELEQQEKKFVKKYFKEEVMPVLSPQIVDANHPFPHLLSKELYVVANLKQGDKTMLGIIPVPQYISNILYLPGYDIRYIRMEKIILEFIDLVFDQYQISDKNYIRVTRNADVSPDDEAYADSGDFRHVMQETLHKRRRMAVVRLEAANSLSKEMEKYFCEKFNIRPECIFRTKMPMKLDFIFAIADKLPDSKKKTLVDVPFSPQPSSMLAEGKVIPQIKKKDVLLCYPYESMEPFLQLIKEASTDPEVLTIKITIYRLAKKARLVEYLCAAAENGKEVTVLIELRARFDEQNNIDWSERLEEAGCRVLYGFEGYKVHSKICLITYRNRTGIHYITQIGTGNYNEKTSRLYTDLSLITADKRIGEEAAKVFQAILLGSVVEDMEHLLVAPKCLQNKVLAMIENEIQIAKEGKPAYIGIKINSLTDKKIIDKLIDASRAGVKIDMVIRGINCLRSGIPGDTGNIHIVSIVGRFLEHSRIYIFGTHDRDKVYIASADFMTRNTLRRVEVAAPLYDETVKNKVRKMFATMLRDNVKAREQQPDGSYQKLSMVGPVLNSQEYFYEEAYMEAGDAFHQLLRKQDMDTEKKQTV